MGRSRAGRATLRHEVATCAESLSADCVPRLRNIPSGGRAGAATPKTSLPLRAAGRGIPSRSFANIAQLVEQRFRKAQVVGSSPTVGSICGRPPARGRPFWFLRSLQLTPRISGNGRNALHQGDAMEYDSTLNRALRKVEPGVWTGWFELYHLLHALRRSIPML